MIEKYTGKKKGSFKKVVKAILIVLLLWFLGHIAFIIIDGITDDNKQADVIVVLGEKVNKDGVPSVRLKSRLDKALEVYNKGLADKIIVSGGADDKNGINEAVVMRDYLISNNVSSKNIIVDENSDSTFDTAENTKNIMEKNNFESVVIVSQYFHITRAKLAFRKYDIEQIYSDCSYIVDLRDLYSIPREFIAYYYYLIFKNA